MTRYVIYAPDRGVYLGNCLGLGFWSRWDAAGQDCAPTFESEQQAVDHVKSWRDATRFTYRVVQVETADDRYATMDECAAAGLPRWTP